MASLHQFHERDDAVSDTVGLNLPHPASRAPPVAPRAYAFCPLAVSLDSIVNIAS